MGKWTECRFPATITLTLKPECRYDEAIIEGEHHGYGLSHMEIETLVAGRTWYDEGCWTLSNGDPGYPPDYDAEDDVDLQLLRSTFPRHKVDVEVDYENPIYED